MNELIKITEKNGLRVVNARDLHEVLVVEAKGGQKGEDFTNWIKRNLDYLDAKLGIDYVVAEYDYLGNHLAQSSESVNQAFRVHKREYALTTDIAKQIAMIQNNDKGKIVRQYFIDCEKKIASVVPVVPKTLKEALYLAAKLEEERERLELQVAENAPKVEVFDKIVDTTNLLSMAEVAQNIGKYGRNTMMANLRVKHILKKDNTPYQQYIDAGYFQVKVTPKSIGNIVVTYVTGKGLTWLTKILNE